MGELDVNGDSRRNLDNVHFTFQDVLFGAVAINLIALPLLLLMFIIAFFLIVTIKIHSGSVELPKTGNVAEGFSILTLILASLCSNACMLCWWGARGFVEVRKLRIGIVTAACFGYSAIMIRLGQLDGYVCLAVTIFIAFVVSVEFLAKRAFGSWHANG